MNEIVELKKIFKDLTSICAPSGYEEPVIKYIVDKVKALGTKPEVDPLGNVTVRLGDPNGEPKMMIIAHMDEIGLVIRKISNEGYLMVEKVGGIPEIVLSGCSLVAINSEGKMIEGVVGNKSHHVTPVSERYNVTPIEKIYIDMGFSSYNEVLNAGIDVGNILVYSRKFIENGPIVFASAVDNRAGCLVLLKLIELLKNKKFNPEVFIVATVQEEFNLRGVLPAARRINPDFSIAIDCVIASDTPDLDKTDISLGKGPAVSAYSFHGRGTLGGVIPNPKLRKLIEEYAIKAGINIQKNVLYGGLTDASFLQLEGNGIPSIELGFPARYTHTPLECCNMLDILKLIQLLEGFILDLPDKVDLSRF